MIKNKLLTLLFNLINKIKLVSHFEGGAGISLYEFTCVTCKKQVVDENPPECLDCCTERLTHNCICDTAKNQPQHHLITCPKPNHKLQNNA